MNANRITSGRPAFNYQGRPVVAGDILALLSGVNFGSVEKLIAATSAISQYAGTDLQSLVLLSDLPTERVVLTAERDRVRAEVSLKFCEDLVDSGKFEHLEGILKLRARFG